MNRLDEKGLKPCPFCGGPAQLIYGGPGNYYVRCEGCSAQSDDRGRDRAIEAWNRRALQAAQPGWRAIEEAPHETNVLLAWRDGTYPGGWRLETGMASWGWRRGGVSNMSEHGQATHFMPLPPAPSAEEGEL